MIRDISGRDTFDPKALLQFQVDKDITYLYKRLLGQLEDLKQQQDEAVAKLLKEIPAQYHPLLRAANFLDTNGFNYQRKRVLDAGNEAKRNAMSQIDKFDISIKFEE